MAHNSIESAITSRLISDAFIPSVPIAIPSLIAIVLTSIGVPPASRTPFITDSASARWLKLHGIVPVQLCATRTSGLRRSSLVSPIDLKYERAGARAGPSTRMWLRCLGSRVIAAPA